MRPRQEQGSPTEAAPPTGGEQMLHKIQGQRFEREVTVTIAASSLGTPQNDWGTF